MWSDPDPIVFCRSDPSRSTTLLQRIYIFSMLWRNVNFLRKKKYTIRNSKTVSTVIEWKTCLRDMDCIFGIQAEYLSIYPVSGRECTWCTVTSLMPNITILSYLRPYTRFPAGYQIRYPAFVGCPDRLSGVRPIWHF